MLVAKLNLVHFIKRSLKRIKYKIVFEKIDLNMEKVFKHGHSDVQMVYCTLLNDTFTFSFFVLVVSLSFLSFRRRFFQTIDRSQQ